jgi:hypothetical protein
MSGFIAKSGSSVSAKIISVPNAERLNNSNNFSGNYPIKSIQKENIIKTLPNPNNGIFKISLSDLK